MPRSFGNPHCESSYEPLLLHTDYFPSSHLFYRLSPELSQKSITNTILSTFSTEKITALLYLHALMTNGERPFLTWLNIFTFTSYGKNQSIDLLNASKGFFFYFLKLVGISAFVARCSTFVGKYLMFLATNFPQTIFGALVWDRVIISNINMEIKPTMRVITKTNYINRYTVKNRGKKIEI